MRSLLLLSAICLQLSWSYGEPVTASKGVGSFAYQDSTGKRYGGTYGIEDGQVHTLEGDPPEVLSRFLDPEEINNDYFQNLETLLQEVFPSNADNQKKALDAAQKAYRQSANKSANLSKTFVPNFASRSNPFGNTYNNYGFGGVPKFGARNVGVPNFGGPNFGVPNFGVPNFGVPNFGMPNFGVPNYNPYATNFASMPFGNNFGPGFGSGYGNRFGSGFGGAGYGFPTGFQNRFGGVQSSNSATAAAAAAPGFTAHYAAINPSNPTIPNVNVVNRFAETGKDGNKGGPGFYTVSSTSYSTSSNLNGKETSSRGAETLVNNNGEVTKYAVHS